MPESGKVIYLTFDDGPTHELCPWILDTLAKYNAKATFFCVGENVQYRQKMFESIVEAGHAVGNHTHNHLNGRKTRLINYLENVALCGHYLDSQLFRPPYGRITRRQARELRALGYKIIMWDVLSYDFIADLNKALAFNKIKQYAGPGSIVVFHDNIKAEANLKYLLPATLAHFSSLGYSFKAIGQLP